ncbi:MAG: leucyl aminopeptidase [Alphaproteobacteria bacterium]|nr:leucyl aminopeptidase [Alphaproteobacteria bacterium]
MKNFPPQADKPVLVIPFAADQDVLPTTGEESLDTLCASALGNSALKIEPGTRLSVYHPEAGQVVLLATEPTPKSLDWQQLGHHVLEAANAHHAAHCRVLLGVQSSVDIAKMCFGARLSHYSFRPYWNKKAAERPAPLAHLEVLCDSPDETASAESARTGLAAGVAFSRDLISEPPNVLYPETFAKRLEDLGELGVKVEVLDEAAMRQLGMNALLGVAQGSVRPPRLVVMHWDNDLGTPQPTAIIGKGVTFDTGGISLKPAKNMEEMKFDMGGAGVISGVMKAIALQKVKMNVVGVVGLAENMPDGNAQRPGDVVTAMDGQTIAIHNTDAEGRLVLADVLHYTNARFKPSAMVDLATLTGAIVVALGSEYAGLFSNNDDLAQALNSAGYACDEKLWRLPLHKNYDKQLDTLVADMCNIGGPEAGAITAAQFLQRFVGDTPWAHLDIAGVVWNNKTKPNYPAGASGFGVTLLYSWLEQRFGGQNAS